MENINTNELFESINNIIEQLKTQITIKDDRIYTLEKEIRDYIDTLACSSYNANKVRADFFEKIKPKLVYDDSLGEVITVKDIENTNLGLIFSKKSARTLLAL